MASFSDLSAPQRVAAHHFVWDVPDGYQQGRGAFGGLVLSTLARAALLDADRPEQPLRTLTAELCGPVQPGRADIHVDMLRAGSGTSTLAVRLLQGGEVQTHAVVVLGRARSAEPRFDGVDVPTMPPYRGLSPLPINPLMPAFSRFFEYWNCAEPGAKVSRGWLRPREPCAVRDAAYLVGMADVWWPALLPQLPVLRPMATLTFTIDVVGHTEGLDPAAPLFHEGRVLAVREGFCPELRTLWGEDGRLLAINQQTFVLIK